MSRVAVPLDLSPHAFRARGERPVGFSGPTMGVTWNVKAFAPAGLDLTSIPTQIQRLLNGLVAQMSNWEPDSRISQFNRAAAGGWLDLAPGFQHVMDRALHWAELSGGAFDPTTGRLVLQEIIAAGGARPALENFRAFRGRDPEVDALLRHSGMIPA